MKNKLLIYMGGGYAGCLWEWNTCLINEETKEITDVCSSGRNAILDYEDYLKCDPEYIEGQYNLDSKKSMEQLVKDGWNPSVLLGTLRGLSNLDNLGEFYVVCEECGQHIYYADDARSTGSQGCGGLASCSTGIRCYECNNMYSCHWCGEWIGQEGWLSVEGKCQYCEKEAFEREIKNQQERITEIIRNMHKVKPSELGKQYQLADQLMPALRHTIASFEEFKKEIKNHE